jgi:hypothetical protein
MSSVLNVVEPSAELEELSVLVQGLIEIEQACLDSLVALECIRKPHFLPRAALLPFSVT